MKRKSNITRCVFSTRPNDLVMKFDNEGRALVNMKEYLLVAFEYILDVKIRRRILKAIKKLYESEIAVSDEYFERVEGKDK